MIKQINILGTLAGILSVGFIVSNTPDKTAYKSNSISKIQLQEEFTPKVEKEIHSPISVVEPIEAKHVFEQGNNEFLIGFVNEFAENNGKVINTWLMLLLETIVKFGLNTICMVFLIIHLFV